MTRNLSPLDARAERIEQLRQQGAELNSRLNEVRLSIGRELREVRRDLEASGKISSCEEWFERNVKLHDRIIRGFIALAQEADLTDTHEYERAGSQEANTPAENPVLATEGGSPPNTVAT